MRKPERGLLLRRGTECGQECTLAGKDAQGATRAAVSRVEDLPHWLSYGTALGLWRDGGVIPGDRDIDISLDAEFDEPPDTKALIERFTSDGYTYMYDLLYDGRPSEIMLMDIERRVCINLYVHYRGFEPGYSWLFFDGKSCRFPENLFLDRKENNTPWGRYFLPWPMESYLEWMYGPGWRQPDDGTGNYRESARARVGW